MGTKALVDLRRETYNENMRRIFFSLMSLVLFLSTPLFSQGISPAWRSLLFQRNIMRAGAQVVLPSIPTMTASPIVFSGTAGLMRTFVRSLKPVDLVWLNGISPEIGQALQYTLPVLETNLSQGNMSLQRFNTTVNFVKMLAGKRMDFFGADSPEKLVAQYAKFPQAERDLILQMSDPLAMAYGIKIVGDAYTDGYLAALDKQYMYLSPRREETAKQIMWTPATEVTLLDLFSKQELDRILIGREWRTADLRSVLGLGKGEDRLIFLNKQASSGVCYTEIRSLEEISKNLPEQVGEAQSVFVYKDIFTVFDSQRFFPSGATQATREDFFSRGNLDSSVNAFLAYLNDHTYRVIPLGMPSTTAKTNWLKAEQFKDVQFFFPVRQLPLTPAQIVSSFREGIKPALRVPPEMNMAEATAYIKQTGQDLAPHLKERILSKMRSSGLDVDVFSESFRFVRSDMAPGNMSSAQDVPASNIHFHYNLVVFNKRSRNLFQVNNSIPVEVPPSLLEDFQNIPENINLLDYVK